MKSEETRPGSKDPYRYEKLTRQITQLIRQGTYRPGERIPSVRQMSRQQGLSISSVLHAYLTLEDQGLIEARPQSGYYVRTGTGLKFPEPEISAPSLDPSHVNLHDLVMRIMKDSSNPNLVQLGAAMPNLELLPTERMNHILSVLARKSDQRTHQYNFPPGLENLRVQIAQRAVTSGCQLAPADIIITSGGTEAIDLCLHAACKPGEIVAIESPMYFGTLQLIEVHGLRALEIPTDPHDGISLGALQFAIEHNPIKAVLTISNFNNPLGSCVPDEKKRDLVELLARYEIPLIDNDVSGEIYFTEKRPLVTKAFDQKGLVMLCSSFSKDISPSLRVGWVAPGRYLSSVEWLKFTLNSATATLPQMAVAEFLESGGYDHHLRRLRREYASNVARLSDAITRIFPAGTRFTRPSGGFVLWVQLPGNVDSLELYALALQSGITLTPGYLFSPTNQFSNFIRLNAAAWSYPIERALGILGDMIVELAGSGSA
ncbi:MAG TPA: PLP-dependent aminotransferase family protein [Anaerolineales bacterium]|nr:PLP-dependent aminotransferase family protein [Anaerolineales bacterium]